MSAEDIKVGDALTNRTTLFTCRWRIRPFADIKACFILTSGHMTQLLPDRKWQIAGSLPREFEEAILHGLF